MEFLSPVTDLLQWNNEACFYHAHIYYRNEAEKTNIKKIRDHAVQMVKDKKWECDIGPFVETVCPSTSSKLISTAKKFTSFLGLFRTTI